MMDMANLIEASNRERLKRYEWWVDIPDEYRREQSIQLVGEVLKAGISPKRLFPDLTRKEANRVSKELYHHPVSLLENFRHIALSLFPHSYHQHFRYCRSLGVIRWAVRHEQALLGQIRIFINGNVAQISGQTLLSWVTDDHLPRGEFTGLNAVKEAYVSYYEQQLETRFQAACDVGFSGSLEEFIDSLTRNPHLVTASMIGLGTIGGEPTESERHGRYMTPLRQAAHLLETTDTNVNLPLFPYSIDDPRIRQLTNRTQLVDEGIRMDHCVGSYTYLCFNGSYIFHVDDGSPEGATVEVKLPKDKEFRITQAEGILRRTAPEAVDILEEVLVKQGLSCLPCIGRGFTPGLMRFD